jgi:hypothetical protein
MSAASIFDVPLVERNGVTFALKNFGDRLALVIRVNGTEEGWFLTSDLDALVQREKSFPQNAAGIGLGFLAYLVVLFTLTMYSHLEKYAMKKIYRVQELEASFLRGESSVA